MYTPIQRWGNSNAVRIPKPVFDSVRFRENERVEIIVDDDGIRILPLRRRHKSLDDLFVDYNDAYDFEEVEFGQAGRELL
jgi:antitoxin MazE